MGNLVRGLCRAQKKCGLLKGNSLGNLTRLQNSSDFRGLLHAILFTLWNNVCPL